jgi:hypothetical protein
MELSLCAAFGSTCSLRFNCRTVVSWARLLAASAALDIDPTTSVVPSKATRVRVVGMKASHFVVFDVCHYEFFAIGRTIAPDCTEWSTNCKCTGRRCVCHILKKGPRPVVADCGDAALRHFSIDS